MVKGEQSPSQRIIDLPFIVYLKICVACPETDEGYALRYAQHRNRFWDFMQRQP